MFSTIRVNQLLNVDVDVDYNLYLRVRHIFYLDDYVLRRSKDDQDTKGFMRRDWGIGSIWVEIDMFSLTIATGAKTRLM